MSNCCHSTENVIVNPTIVCLNGQPALVSGCGVTGGAVGGPTPLPPCDAPENRFAPALPDAAPATWTPGQMPWSAEDAPGSLFCAPPVWVQERYQQHFGRSAVPSTAGSRG